MTFREKLAQDHPEWSIRDIEVEIEQHKCPAHYGYESDQPGDCERGINCGECWNREMPEENKSAFVTLGETVRQAKETLKETLKEDVEYMQQKIYDTFGIPKDVLESPKPTIKDSGDRTEFASGAVRDMHEGKGRCDLLPLDVVWEYIRCCRRCEKDAAPIGCIMDFISSGDTYLLHMALSRFVDAHYDSEDYTMILEVAKHFEEGAKKYGDNNWRKGIPVRCYIDSAVRHYLKYLRGDKDEPHDRAFCWNILCCIWTCKHMPELNDYAKKEEN